MQNKQVIARNLLLLVVLGYLELYRNKWRKRNKETGRSSLTSMQGKIRENFYYDSLLC